MNEERERRGRERKMKKSGCKHMGVDEALLGYVWIASEMWGA